ncbi:MAG: type II toxin-antitoxin system PemK/MazF family toxin [Candidatus Dadabacteria bacterium]|nr:type II toxin-antitoxin system PemK/MazF family toxin [Candidatus Dadabacteria bacterium]MDE0519217.1 type II toxin-antitoxin system PemK/MazF family toxin [Candidatus Dadabacteria bacterium]MDE0663521.1 type II toxin-antitoxin system PemK/MazF family toxin [Candidatus Dadabacteria bacterium]
MHGVTFKPHDIVVVSFPFTDSSVKKRRPALVISSEEFNENHDQLILAMVTTAKRSSWQSDIKLKDPADANLAVPSVVRLKLFTLEKSMIIRRLGCLSKKDKNSVDVSLKQHILDPAL